jgi:hypothetical protein
VLEALKIKGTGIQQRNDFEVFEQRKFYEDMTMKLSEEGKIQSSNQPWIDFYQKIN